MRYALLPLLVSALWARTVTNEEVERVHRSALLIDTHNDVTSRTVDGFDIGSAAGTGHTDISRLRQGGVGAQFFAVYVAAAYAAKNQSAHRALEMIDTVRHDIVERYPAEFKLATTAAEIEDARKRGKIAALMGIEGGHAIENSLRLLRDYYDLGVRYMTLTHNNSNDWADSSRDVERHHGLTSFGKDVVREMNRLGMMIDVSHVSDKTFWDALALSRAPVFASHSSPRALVNTARNMSDEMIAALAKKGGVVQVNVGCSFVSRRYNDAARAVRERLAAFEKTPDAAGPNADAVRKRIRAEYASIAPATLADVVAAIDHIKRVGGIDAVGIGSDFDGVPCTPAGLEDVSKFPDLTRALLEKGYSAEDIRKIYGANLLRVMRAVERARAPVDTVPPVARALPGLIPVLDTHNDVTSATIEGFDIGSRGGGAHTDIGRLRQGGVTGVFFAAYVDAKYEKSRESAHRALEMVDTVRRDIVDRYNGDFAFAGSSADIEGARRNGKIAALIGIEGGHAIENSPRLLRQFYNLGVRYMTLTHVNTNAWADSSGDIDNNDVAHHRGLTGLGREIVREMNRIGMIVDVSHVSDKTFYDALETSSAPLMASHSSCRALDPAGRNMTDEMIQAIAKRGGTIQINFNCGYLAKATLAGEAALEKQVGFDEAAFKKAFASGRIPRATLADAVAHFAHARAAGGPRSVGVGSDFDGVPCTPEGLDDVSRFPELARALAAAGFSAGETRAVFFDNPLRVLRAVEDVAHKR